MDADAEVDGPQDVTEDVPCGLVAMSALGDAVGVATPVIDGLIALSGAMLGRDFAKEGRNLEYLGLAGNSAKQIKKVFELGPGVAGGPREGPCGC